MYIHVIPLEHSLDTDILTYLCPKVFYEFIHQWSLVEIPIGNHLCHWIVANLEVEIPENINPENIRSIVHVISSSPLLSPYQITAIPAIAKHFLIPIHKITNLFLPKSHISSLEKKNFLALKNMESLEAWKWAQGKLYFSSKSIITAPLLEKILTPSSALIFPDDIFLDAFLKETTLKGDDSIIVRWNSTPTKKTKAWIDAYNGEKKIILWTRKILYYNLAAFDTLYYIEDAFYKTTFQYPNTLWHLDILHILLSQGNKNISIVSSVPSSHAFSLIKKDFALINI